MHSSQLSPVSPSINVAILASVRDTLNYFGDRVCSGCAESSDALVSTLIVSLITYLPNISTNVLRIYPSYNVNCHKTFGSFVGLFSMVMSLYTWLGYKKLCFSIFYDGVISCDRNGTAIPLDEFKHYSDAEKRALVLVSMDYDWWAGPGLFCIVAATGLKLVMLFVT